MGYYGEGPEHVTEAYSYVWDLMWENGWSYNKSIIHLNTLVLTNVYCGKAYMNVWSPTL